MTIIFDGKGNIEATTDDDVIAVKLYSLEKTIEEKDKEIERLKAREEECMNAYLRARQDVSEYEGKYVVDEYIINELEKWLEENDKQLCLRKLRELKEGSDKE